MVTIGEYRNKEAYKRMTAIRKGLNMLRRYKIYKDIPGYEYGYVGSPADMAGVMYPFRPHWWAQYLGNGAWEMFDTKEQARAWCMELAD